MQLLLNASILRAPRTGIGQYVAELGSALSARADCSLRYFDGMRWAEHAPVAAMPGYSRLSHWGKRILPDAYALRRVMQQRCFKRGVRAGRDCVYHEPSLWPFEYDGAMVMTLHDLTHVHYPQTQPADRLRAIERYSEPAVARAQRILVDSQFIADEVCRYYALDASRVQVAPLGYNARFHPRHVSELYEALASLALTAGQYLLCVGTLEPRKNLSMVLQAYACIPATVRARYPLVLVGMAGWHRDQLTPMLKQAIASGSVRVLGYLSDDTLAQLYAGARALIFPSLYEGFGLPVLEAMASGTPVLLSNTSSLPEVAGSAGIYVDSDDIASCTEKLLQLIDDQVYWQNKREEGLRQCLRFSWQRCADITAEAYRHALEQV